MSQIQIINGDITTIEVEAIVNAANTSLLGGGGVDGAIHRKGGKTILQECQKIRNEQGGCKVGHAVLTSAGNLPAQFVIHAVGPTWTDGTKQEPDLLKQTYESALTVAVENNIHSVAFPNLSTGRYRFPKKRAAAIAFDSVYEFLNTDPRNTIIFVCFDLENYEIYCELLRLNKSNITTTLQ